MNYIHYMEYHFKDKRLKTIQVDYSQLIQKYNLICQRHGKAQGLQKGASQITKTDLQLTITTKTSYKQVN